MKVQTTEDRERDLIEELPALSQMPTSGLDYENMDEKLKQTLNTLPAMIYHGVNTPEAILMRMNSAPRSIAERLGERYKGKVGAEKRSVWTAGNSCVRWMNRDGRRPCLRRLR